MTTVLHIWRPEATGDGEGGEPHNQAPFDGIETYLVDGGEDKAMELADRLANLHPTWKFYVDAHVKEWWDGE